MEPTVSPKSARRDPNSIIRDEIDTGSSSKEQTSPASPLPSPPQTPSLSRKKSIAAWQTWRKRLQSADGPRSNFKKQQSVAAWKGWNERLQHQSESRPSTGAINEVEIHDNHSETTDIELGAINTDTASTISSGEENIQQPPPPQPTEQPQESSSRNRSLFRTLQLFDATMPEWHNYLEAWHEQLANTVHVHNRVTDISNGVSASSPKRKRPSRHHTWHTLKQMLVGLLIFFDAVLRGSGQVVFMNNPVSGAFILVGFFIESSWLAVGALVGVAMSTLTAVLFNINRAAYRGGLFGYNGLLVGAALATFLAGGEWSARTLLIIAVTAGMSTIIHVTLGNLLIPTWRIAPFTLAFNISTIIVLMGAVTAFRRIPVVPAPPPASADDVLTDDDITAELVFTAIIKGVGQVFLLDNMWSGGSIVLGMAVCSRVSAVASIVGSTVGCLTALAVGADLNAVYHGLWGYNAVLGVVAVGGVFYVLHGWKIVPLAVACGVLCTVMLGTFQCLLRGIAPQGYALPALTFPFCFGTMAFVGVQGSIGGVVPVDLTGITTAEGHYKRFKRTTQTPE